MAVTCTGVASVALSWNWLDTRTDGSETHNADSFSKKISFTGSGIDNVIPKVYTIAASGTQIIDLSGANVDVGNNTVTWTKLMALIIVHDTATTSTAVSFGPHVAANPLAGLMVDTSDRIRINNGGALLWMTPAATPVVVAGGSADSVSLVNLDATNSATIYIGFLGKS